jgi:hypothetical protein
MGLAAGDRNGGPQRLAMRVAEAMLHQPAGAAQLLDVASIVRRYASWTAPGTHHRGVEEEEDRAALWPPEPERAYDTGQVFARVFSALSRRSDLTAALNPSASITATAPVADDDASHEGDADPDALVAQAAFAVAEADFKRFQSAGVGACHRNAVVAASRRLFATDAAVADAARRESRVTHSHPEAVETAAAVAAICRSLIESAPKYRDRGGASCRSRLLAAISAAAAVCDFDAAPVLKDALSCYLVVEARAGSAVPREGVVDPREPSHREGFSPLVLAVALYFLWHGEAFSSALASSIRFAGPANFCPVLVGSIGGALWGYGGTRGVQREDLDHPHYTRSPGHAPRFEAAADGLAAEWGAACFACNVLVSD